MDQFPSLFSGDTPPLHRTAKVPPKLQDALAESISGTPFLDTTFYAFSRRLPSGTIDTPKPILSNSAILKASSPYFRALLSGSFSESKSSAAGIAQSTDSYDYESDSDLDDLEDRKEDEEPEMPAAEDEDKNQEPLTPGRVKPAPKKGSAWGVSGTSNLRGDTMNTHIVSMRSIAAKTLESLIFYVYTGQVYFLPLKSCGRKARQEGLRQHISRYPKYPICSPKSMYRLADEFGFDELRQKAKDSIFSQLSAENILHEVFSKFSSRYDAILMKQVEYLVNHHWNDRTKFALGSKIDIIVQGEMSHASPALTLLLSQIPSPVKPEIVQSKPAFPKNGKPSSK